VSQTAAVTRRLTIRSAALADDVPSWLPRSGGETTMAVHGHLYDAAALPALVAATDTDVLGVFTYTLEGHALKIVPCNADPPGQGVGRALVEATVSLARAQCLRRVWCTTTNDNLAVLGFWQALGFVLLELRPGAEETARRLKPSIPLHGYRGLPIRDEIDLERTLLTPGPRRLE